MSARTPGPWTRDKYGNIIDQHGEDVRFRKLCVLCSGSKEEIEKAEGNTDLVAAAPELLDAAEHFLNDVSAWHKNHVRNFASYSDLKAAIAKAKGELE